MTRTATYSDPDELIGQTVHVLRGSKYQGAWDVSDVGAEDANGYFTIKAGLVQYAARLVDCFPTEAAARAEAKTRRRPRQARQPVALYGDFAQLAAFSGLATDGTGRRVR